MKKLVHFKNLNLHKLNKAEYTNFMDRFIRLTTETGADALHYEQEDMDRLHQLCSSLQDLVARSAAAAETAEMENLEKQRDQLGQYIIDTVRAGQTLPLASKAEAAKTLWLVLKPYVGFYDLPHMQETATIEGMIIDLSKTENATHLATLGLADYVTELSAINGRYKTLTEQRTAARDVAKTDNSKTIRTEMDALYDYITTVAFAHHVVAPADTIAQYIRLVNTIIDETNTAYNQRMTTENKAEETEK